ncbi:hypothetical protein Poli38472_001371 [Pythium oligandrum]|uniref:Uncharacterized protein n=1 Tax=Pythium oligandrum TaxID=41045 RepID=A0A8K1CV28_PYTOL|nr:hypothetical protein Poli38472_001371 [Pythium oligandrum]|eukprot:TMW69215.1 hypothetical protein Poli38472_001371 [Pythium oligandrum]
MLPFSLSDSVAAMGDDEVLAALKHECTNLRLSLEEEEEPEIEATNQSEEEDATRINKAEEVVMTGMKSKKNVRFADADVIEFEPSAWTATVASDGVPVGLSSTVRRRLRRRLDEYEEERKLERIDRQEYMEHGYLEADERLDILEAAGHSIAIINHVERESIRVNRERWESNEYDLLYQYGLGEDCMLDLDEEDELLLSQGGSLGDRNIYSNNNEEEEEDDADMMESEDETNNVSDYYYINSRSMLADNDVRFAMEDMDSYDTRKYDEWAWDYSSDVILGDNVDQESVDLPYSKDSFDGTSDCGFDISDMSSSPTDVSVTPDRLMSSPSKLIGAGSSSLKSGRVIV